jgi:site-specific recombinase XerD
LVKQLKDKATIDNSALQVYLQTKKKVAATLPQPAAALTDYKTVAKRPLALSPAWQLCSSNLAALESFVQLLQLKAYSKSTITTYRNEFIQLLKLLKQKPVDALTVEDLKRYMSHILVKERISESTAHSRLNALKFYFEQVLGREKFFWEIPRPKKPQKLPKVISEEKILEGLLKVPNLKHKTLLLLAYSAGMRVSEVVSLQVTDINSDRMQININDAKGKKDRVVTLSNSLLPILREYYIKYKPVSWLFEGANSQEHYSSRSAQQVFKDAYKKLGLPPQCSFHSLRHSYATHLLENGTDISFIQKLLGHNDIKTTLRYAQVSKKDIGKIESPLDRVLRKKGL